MCGKVAASQSPSWVLDAAVEGLDQRLAVLVVPEADAGRLALLDGPGRGRPLAVVVVQGVEARRQVDGRTGRRETVPPPVPTLLIPCV